jgi:hypothetical protein
VRAEVAGVVADAVDEAGLAASQERHAHEVQAGCRCHAAVVEYPTVAVEDGHVEPGDVGPVAGGPDDGLDLPACEVEQQRR